jgi:hypothetical protein
MSDKDSLEEQNINNVISYYKAELRLVLEGASVEKVFSASERKKLRSKGILGFSHTIWFITERAKEILNT